MRLPGSSWTVPMISWVSSDASVTAAPFASNNSRGRKQYRYHADYRARQDASKYDGCREFGEALPKLRKRVETDRKSTRLNSSHSS